MSDIFSNQRLFIFASLKFVQVGSIHGSFIPLTTRELRHISKLPNELPRTLESQKKSTSHSDLDNLNNVQKRFPS